MANRSVQELEKNVLKETNRIEHMLKNVKIIKQKALNLVKNKELAQNLEDVTKNYKNKLKELNDLIKYLEHSVKMLETDIKTESNNLKQNSNNLIKKLKSLLIKKPETLPLEILNILHQMQMIENNNKNLYDRISLLEQRLKILTRAERNIDKTINEKNEKLSRL